MPVGDSMVAFASEKSTAAASDKGRADMARAAKITALRGMRDVFNAEYERRHRVQRTLERHFRLYGYLPIDLPILENTELYLRKSGEDISARLYEFDFKNRRIALRPELTASVARAYVESLRDEPLPLRLQYSGPVFRYEKPQQNRYRQFTMTGAELLGAGGAAVDAELLHLACRGLEQVGINDYKLVIGHTAALEGFLRQLGLRKQLLNQLLRNMENLRKRGLRHVVASLQSLVPEFDYAADEGDPAADADAGSGQQLINVLREMTDGEARQAITDFLRSLNIRIDAKRDEGEIIDRLLHKIREDEQGPKLRVALDYMARLGELRGSPADVLPRARALAAEYKLEGRAMSALADTLACLADYGDPRGDIELDFGLNRGLHYYTGLMFEIHCQTADGEALQLCGGGRYDNLVSILGAGEPAPAAGFAYGLERVARVASQGERASLNQPDVYLIPITSADARAAYQVANELRQRDIVVEASVDGRSLRRSLKHADRKGASLVIIIGEAERKRNAAILRAMGSHQEWTAPLDELPRRVEELLKAHD